MVPRIERRTYRYPCRANSGRSMVSNERIAKVEESLLRKTNGPTKPMAKRSLIYCHRGRDLGSLYLIKHERTIMKVEISRDAGGMKVQTNTVCRQSNSERLLGKEGVSVVYFKPAGKTINLDHNCGALKKLRHGFKTKEVTYSRRE
ncbi:hypothetical protein TNCV_154091 [Trichonephila clavipes]|nr:hypothetical protein TNCV_154091 [Trichonephila clavipes]